MAGRNRTWLVYGLGAWGLWLLLALGLNGEPDGASSDAAADTPWGLSGPNLDATPTANALQRLDALQLWGKPAAAAGASASAQSGNAAAKSTTAWQLIGIAEEAGRRHALVKEGEGQWLRLQAGQVLPDGAVIRGIDASAIEVESQGRRRWVRLYTKQDQARTR